MTIVSIGVNIGDGCIVGANSFVNQSFGSHVIIAGNSAREIIMCRNCEHWRIDYMPEGFLGKMYRKDDE